MTISVKNFIIERLLEYDSSYDVGGGIATTKLMINPLSVILQPLRDELDEIKTTQTIMLVLDSVTPNSIDEDVVDALVSNVLIERKDGDKATGSVRVRFFSPQAVDIGTGLAVFLDSSGNKFVNTSAVSATASEMSLNVDESLYYIDIPLTAEKEGIAYNAAVGAISTWENEPENIANITNLSAFTLGIDKETNTKLIDRAKLAVTVRALVTGRGIVTTLTTNFSTIDEIKPIGFGDPEMQRDIVYNVHIGGNVDVWVKIPTFTQTYQDITAGLIVDATRRERVYTTKCLETADLDYPLFFSNVDTTVYTPIVKSADGLQTFVSGTDYVLTTATAMIKRPSGTSSIVSISGTTPGGDGTSADAAGDIKIFTDTTGVGKFINIRAGMRLKITSPATVAGSYNVKSIDVGLQSLTIYGKFPFVESNPIQYVINDIVGVSYDTNPYAIDIIKTARSTARASYTITSVPLMRIVSIEKLDPTTGKATGSVLDSSGGFGQGGFGVGQWGVGALADYWLKVKIPNLRFSNAEDNYISFKDTLYGHPVRVTFDYAAAVTSIQTYCDNALNRNESSDLKVKHFIPVFVTPSASINYYVKTSNTAASTAAVINTAVSDLIHDTAISADLEASDIVDILYDNGADKVDLDWTLKGEIHNTDGSVRVIEADAKGVLAIPTNLSTTTLIDTDKPLSKNIAHFYPGTITLVRNAI